MTSTGFKPNFNLVNPYQGAPPEYIQSIMGTQAYMSAVNRGWIYPTAPVPTTPGPAPPAPPPAPPAPPKLPIPELEVITVIKPPETGIEKPTFGRPMLAAETVTIGRRTRSPYEVYNTPEIQELARKDPYLYKVLRDEGMEGYEEAARQREGAFIFAERSEAERFKAIHTQLPDGQWIANKDLEDVRGGSPELYRLLTTQGFTAVSDYINVQNELYEKNQAAIKKLDRYADKDGMVDIHSYIKDNPGDFDTLKNAGISQDAIGELRRRQELEEKVDKDTMLALLGVITPSMRKKREEQRAEFDRLPLKAKIAELTRAVNKWYETSVSVGTTGVSISTQEALDKLRSLRETKVNELPAPVREPTLFGASVLYGAVIMAPAYQAAFGGQLLKTIWADDKLAHVKDIGKGMGDYFTKEIPALFKKDPTMTVGELTGMFVIGPERVLKFAKATGARISPTYIPKRGIAIEYSVVNVPKRVADARMVTEAVNKAIVECMKSEKGEAIVKIGDGRIRLKLRSTPVSEVAGPAFYHITPELAATLKEGYVKGKLFASPQAAFRFAESTAHGVPGTKPAVLMIFSKDGRVKWSVTENLYKAGKEVEVTYPTTKFTRAQNLYSRLHLGKTGEFVTVHNGEVIPIYRFAESGATVPKMGLVELAAVRVRTIKATLADILKGKRGYEILEGESLADLTKRIEREAGKLAKSKRTTLESAVDMVARREIDRAYRISPKVFERAFRVSPEAFEANYRAQLDNYSTRSYIERLPVSQREAALRALELEIMAERARIGIEETRIYEIPARELRLPTVEVPEEIARIEPTERLPRVPPRVPPREPLRVPPREPPRVPPRVPPREPPRVPPRTPSKLSKDATDEEKRRYISESGGAFAWHQGQLHGKRVWHVAVAPWDKKICVLGPAPEGATIVEGKGQAYKSIKLLRGEPPAKPVKYEGGAVDPVVSATGDRKGVRIEFVPDKEVYRKGNIRIVERPAEEPKPKLKPRGGFRTRAKKPRARDLGADIVQEGRRRHIRLS